MNRAKEFTVKALNALRVHNRRRAMLLLKLALTEIEELQQALEADQGTAYAVQVLQVGATLAERAPVAVERL